MSDRLVGAASREASPASPLRQAAATGAAAAAGGATGTPSISVAGAAAGVATVLNDEQAAEQDQEEVGCRATHLPAASLLPAAQLPGCCPVL